VYGVGAQALNPSGYVVVVKTAHTASPAYATDAAKSQATPFLISSPELRDQRNGIKAAFLGNSHTEGVGASNVRFSSVRQTIHNVGLFYLSLASVNAGIAGQNTSAMRGRLAAIVDTKPGLLVLEDGSNDASEAAPLAESNLNCIVREARRAGAPVVIVGVPRSRQVHRTSQRPCRTSTLATRGCARGHLTMGSALPTFSTHWLTPLQAS
jgi:hypothetical protein